MDREQFKEYIRYIYDSNIRSRLGSHRLRGHHRHRFPEDGFSYEWSKIVEIAQLLKLINRISKHDGDPYRIFNQERLHNLTDEVRWAVNYTDNIAEDAGFLEAMDEHFDEIVDGMEIDDFPAEELEILRQLGSDMPRGELLALITKVKSSIPQREKRNELSISQALKNVDNRLAQKTTRPSDKTEELPKKSRKWFKGLGKIITGVGLTVGDIGLAIGLIPLPALGQIPTSGALVSATAGVGTILDGAGELRGE